MLTDARIKAAKPGPKPVKLSDAGGLYLLVSPGGSRGWRLKYRYRGAEKLISLGVYPAVTLKSARDLRDENKAKLRAGIDPSAERKAAKAARGDTFKLVGEQYLESRSLATSFRTQHKADWLLDLLKPLHSLPIGEIRTPDVLEAVRRIERVRGRHETAHRAASLAYRIFRFAMHEGRLDRNPAADLRGALKPVTSTSRAGIVDPEGVGFLLRAIDVYQGSPVVCLALKISPLVFVRPSELRNATWSEIDLPAAEWRIAGERMKMRRPHVVPLARQTLALFKQLHEISGDGKLVFPGPYRTRPLSDVALTSALRRMGYTGKEMTWHGFRTTASTLLRELGWNDSLVELQLAHADTNKVRAAYNKAEQLPERRKMMQAWADYLDEQRATYPEWLALPGDRLPTGATVS